MKENINRSIPIFYKSDVTGKLYAYDEYANHGKCGIYMGFIDLPANEYPYSVIYKEPEPPLWMK